MRYSWLRFGFLAVMLAGCFHYGNAQFLNWTYRNILNDISEPGANPDMAIDPANGTIHLSYWNRNIDKVVYAYRPLGSAIWTKEYIDSQHANGYKSAICLDSQGSPHVAFFENVNGSIEIRYAYRTGPGAWVLESLPDDLEDTYGEYGPNTASLTKDALQHTLDLTLDANDSPRIVFFDAWMVLNHVPSCETTSQWDYKATYCEKTAGLWTVQDLGVLPGRFNVCWAGSPLPPQGDRYGEFSNVYFNSDGEVEIATVSRYNAEVMTFTQDTLPGVWKHEYLDSLSRLPSAAGYLSWVHTFFTWEGLSAFVGQNGTENFTYTSSLVYGDNFCCLNDLAQMVFTKRDTAGNITYYDFGGGDYRAHTALVGSGDSLYFSYSNLTSVLLMMAESQDGGQTWSLDTIMPMQATTASPISIYGDSIFVMSYNVSSQVLTLCSRAKSGGNWVFSPVTVNQNRGVGSDAAFNLQPGDTSLILGYFDDAQDKLYFSKGTKASNWTTWSTEEIDSNATGILTVSTAHDLTGNPMLAYNNGSQLKLASQSGVTWSYEVIDSFAYPMYLDMAVNGQDSIFLSWYNSQEKRLCFASRHSSGGTWLISHPDTTTQFHGQFTSLGLDDAGQPWISYYAEHDFGLWLAKRNGGIWSVDSVFGNGQVPMGKFNSLAVKTGNLGAVSFLDEQNNKVYYGEESAPGSWNFEVLDSSWVYNLGKPTRLEIDHFGNPWIAYNFNANFDQVKLIHRDTSWHQVGVSTAGRISNHFSFLILGDDLYLAGKKNDPQSLGVAMIFAPRGLYVEEDEPSETLDLSLEVFPNPAESNAFIRVNTTASTRIHIQIRDLQGRTVLPQMEPTLILPGQTDLPLDIQPLPAGLYFVEISARGQKATTKLVVLRSN